MHSVKMKVYLIIKDRPYEGQWVYTNHTYFTKEAAYKALNEDPEFIENRYMKVLELEVKE